MAWNVTNLNLSMAEGDYGIALPVPVGGYVYCLDWYQNGNFMCNIIPSAQFKVVDKA